MGARLAGILVSLSLAILTASAPARADEEAYKQHMAAGAKLLEEENHAAARAEFEAAYRAEPKGAALVNVAACEKALFRYPQAIAALEQALRDHRATLDEADRKAAEASLADLKAQLGFVQIILVPADATLRIDGEDQPKGVAQRTIPLAPGSHRLEARMAGHTPAGQTITIASGETGAVKLRLVPGSPDASPDPTSELRKAARGPYVLGAANVIVPLPPKDFSGAGVGFSVGARGGYRFAPVAAAELGVEYARTGVSGEGRPSFDNEQGTTYPLAYALSSFRASLHVRLMTTGERVRFVQTLGGGVAVDSMSWKPGAGDPVRQDAKGVNGFALSETGLELDFGGPLLGVTLQTILASSGGLDHEKHDDYSAETYGGPQLSFGLGLRGGYRFW